MTDYDGDALELKCINTIRAVSADQPQAANSGHPGAPMGCAPMAHLLWKEVMKYSPSNPEWWNRDRFVLSNGHACALQYTMLHLTGYGLTTEDLQNFRKLNSKTPGHPENFMTAGESSAVQCSAVRFKSASRRKDTTVRIVVDCRSPLITACGKGSRLHANTKKRTMTMMLVVVDGIDISSENDRTASGVRLVWSSPFGHCVVSFCCCVVHRASSETCSMTTKTKKTTNLCSTCRSTKDSTHSLRLVFNCLSLSLPSLPF